MFELSAARKKKYITIDMKYTIGPRANVIRYLELFEWKTQYIRKENLCSIQESFRTTGCRFYIRYKRSLKSDCSDPQA